MPALPLAGWSPTEIAFFGAHLNRSLGSHDYCEHRRAELRAMIGNGRAAREILGDAETNELRNRRRALGADVRRLLLATLRSNPLSCDVGDLHRVESWALDQGDVELLEAVATPGQSRRAFQGQCAHFGDRLTFCQ